MYDLSLHPAHELLAGCRAEEPSLTIPLYGGRAQWFEEDADGELLSNGIGVRGEEGSQVGIDEPRCRGRDADEVLAVGRQLPSQLLHLFLLLVPVALRFQHIQLEAVPRPVGLL